MSKLYLIRHGQAMFGKGKEEYDRLSEIGLRQAELLAVHWEKIGLSVDALYCGTLERQRQTAQRVSAHYQRSGLAFPALTTASGLDEFDAFNVWEHHVPALMRVDPELAHDIPKLMADKQAFQRVFDKVVARWISGADDPPGCIKWLDFKAQVAQELERIVAAHGPDDQIALFTSGGVIAVAVQYALNLADDKAIALIWRVYNASISQLKHSSRGFMLAGFNDVSYLETVDKASLLTLR